MKRIANPIETTELCAYGCGAVAKFINGSNRLMCCKSSNSCPANRKKNSDALRQDHVVNKRDYKGMYDKLPQETKDRMAWNRGQTKETNSSVAKYASKLKGRPGISRTHTQETKDRMSKIRTEWLKKSENRKNLGRHKRSWMEQIFEQYLVDNNVEGWDTEVHFWNDELRKNYYPDFIFLDKHLIIELDGTQHRKTVEQDSIRDLWFAKQGYAVIRIPVEEFKKRYFSNQGFMDLIG
jgi:very-short-patch-repair endonuclease